MGGGSLFGLREGEEKGGNSGRRFQFECHGHMIAANSPAVEKRALKIVAWCHAAATTTCHKRKKRRLSKCMFYSSSER